MKVNVVKTIKEKRSHPKERGHMLYLSVQSHMFFLRLRHSQFFFKWIFNFVLVWECVKLLLVSFGIESDLSVLIQTVYSRKYCSLVDLSLSPCTLSFHPSLIHSSAHLSLSSPPRFSFAQLVLLAWILDEQCCQRPPPPPPPPISLSFFSPSPSR